MMFVGKTKQQRLYMLRRLVSMLAELGQRRNTSLDAMKIAIQVIVRETQPEVDVDLDYESDLVRRMVNLLERAWAVSRASEHQLVPTAKSYIDALEKVVRCAKDDNDGDGDGELQCVICANEIVVGETRTGLPCHHTYHNTCIVTWLRRTHTCPLCRFELPVDVPPLAQS